MQYHIHVFEHPKLCKIKFCSEFQHTSSSKGIRCPFVVHVNGMDAILLKILCFFKVSPKDKTILKKARYFTEIEIILTTPAKVYTTKQLSRNAICALSNFL